jgi:hypothetical protein
MIQKNKKKTKGIGKHRMRTMRTKNAVVNVLNAVVNAVMGLDGYITDFMFPDIPWKECVLLL